MLYHHGHLLLLAKKAYGRSIEEPTEASVSVMLSAMTLECYVNELTHRVTHYQQYESHERLSQLSFLLNEYEKNKNSLISKIELIYFVLSSRKPDRGSQHFQNLNMLIKIRNALVHRKPESVGDFEADSEKTYSLHPYVKYLVERKVLPKPSDKIAPVWYHHISCSPVAAWAYNTVVECITSTVEMLPESVTKQIEEFTTKHEKI